MRKFLKLILTSVLPYSVFNFFLIKRQLDIPNYSLKSRHIKGATLVANRDDMLKLFKKKAVVAEIGVDEGVFTQSIVNTCYPTKLHLIDIWGTARYSEMKASSVKEKFKNQLTSGSMEITRKLSTDAAKDFEESYFDWIYIDTDHTYETTLSELYAFSEKVKKDGIIAGHDYSMGNWKSSFKYGVIEAVAEFCVKENWKICFLSLDYTESPSFAITRIS